MFRVTQDLLATWRESERVLKELPSGSPRRVVLAESVEALRQSYNALERTDWNSETFNEVRWSDASGQIAVARELIAAIKADDTVAGA